MEQIAKDLIELRLTVTPSQREFGEIAEINYGKIQRFESREQEGLSLPDMAAWLKACGSSLVVYFGQLSMTNDLKVLNEDVELVEKFKRALKIPAKRQLLKLYLDGLFAGDAQPSGKNRPVSRGRRGAQRGGRAE